MGAANKMEYILYAIPILLYLFIILYKISMSKIKVDEINKKLFFKTIGVSLGGAIVTAFIYKVILSVHVSRCFWWDFSKCILIIFGIFLFVSYLVFYYYNKKEWDWDAIIGITIVIGISLTISGGIQTIILEDCNSSIDYDISPTGYFANYVKGAIYIYDNVTGHENITMILCNEQWANIRETVTFKLEFPEGYEISLREKDKKLDMYQIKGVEISFDEGNNEIKIIWEDPKIDEPLRGFHCLFVNLSVTWTNNTNNFISPNRFSFKVMNFDYCYVAKILGEPPLRLLKKGEPLYTTFREWYIESIIDDIVEYQVGEKEDWI